jgi:hypothetical protein
MTCAQALEFGLLLEAARCPSEGSCLADSLVLVGFENGFSRQEVSDLMLSTFFDL